MAVQARRNIDNAAFLLSGGLLVREAETIAQDAARIIPLAPKTVMAKTPGAATWVPLTEINPAATPATCTTGALGTDLAGFQAVANGEFSIPVDGVDIELAGLDFGVISTPLDTPATATCGVNGALLAAWQAIANGEFRIPINGVNVDIIGCDFNAGPVPDLAGVADVINVISVPLGARCLYDVGTNVYSFVTTLTGQTATLGVLAAVPGGAGTNIAGAGHLNGGAAALVAGAGGIYGVTIADVINVAAAGRFRVEHEPTTDTMVFISPTTGQGSAIGPLEPLAVPVGTPIEVAGFLNGVVGTAVLVAATGFSQANIPTGIYIGDEILAATLVAGNVTNCPIIVGGTATINSDQIVLEGGLALTDIIVHEHKTIREVLTDKGMAPESVILIAGYET